MIEKGKITEIWDKNHQNIIKYTQTLKDNHSNTSLLLEGETLNDLMYKVKSTLIESKINGSLNDKKD